MTKGPEKGGFEGIDAGVTVPDTPPDEELTLLIPTLGRTMIRDTLRSVLGGSRWPGHIIVVDQGRQEAIRDWLDQIDSLGIRTLYLPSSERGRAKGLNEGLAHVTSRYVAITDDDCLVDQCWVGRMGDALREQAGRLVTGRVTTAGSEPVLSRVLHTDASVARRPGLIYDRFSGGNCGAPMAVFRAIGMFDDDPCVALSEDGELAYRALRHGVEIAYVPQIVVSHRGWRQSDERAEQYAGYARSHAAFFGKYLRQLDAFMILRALVHLLRSSRRWAAGAMRGDAEAAAYGRAYVTGFLPGLLQGLGSDRRPPSLPCDKPHPG